MYGEFCETYSPNAERKRELEEMDLKTLELLYNQLDKTVTFLREKKPKSKSIVGMEVAIQIIFDMIADKKLIEK